MNLASATMGDQPRDELFSMRPNIFLSINFSLIWYAKTWVIRQEYQESQDLDSLKQLHFEVWKGKENILSGYLPVEPQFSRADAKNFDILCPP